MTRINLLPPEDLCMKHLLSECRELPRIMSLARKNTLLFKNKDQWGRCKHPPKVYTLGAGHVNFFVDKILFLNERYKKLCAEWKRRGYKIKQVPEEDLLFGIDASFLNNYTPTQEAISLNLGRINERLADMNIERINNRGGLRS